MTNIPSAERARFRLRRLVPRVLAGSVIVGALWGGASCADEGPFALEEAAVVPDSLVPGWGTRPNVLVIVADDLSWLHMGWMGDGTARTPNLDRVAAESTGFSAAFTSTSSCSGSRASLLTGRHAFNLGDAINLFTPLPDSFDTYPRILQEAGYSVGFAGKGWGPGVPTLTRGNPAGRQYSSFRAFLSQVPPSEPFVFWHGSFRPHRPYEAGSGIAAGFDVVGIDLPPIWPDDPIVRSDLADYYRMVESFDAEVGVLLDELSSRGLEGETLVVVTSDNGMPFPRCKTFLFDCGTRMPLLVRWPGIAPAGVRSEALVTLVDLAPTFLNAAGIPAHQGMAGRSLSQSIQDGGHEYVLMARERHGTLRLENGQAVGYPIRAVRTRDFLYVRNERPERGVDADIDVSPTASLVESLWNGPGESFFARVFGRRPSEELYAAADDPWQLNNVANSPTFKGVKAELRSFMEAKLREFGDPRALGRGDVFDAAPVYPERP